MTSEQLEFQITASNCRKTNHAYYHFTNSTIPNTEYRKEHHYERSLRTSFANEYRKEHHFIQLSNDQDVSLQILGLRVEVQNVYCRNLNQLLSIFQLIFSSLIISKISYICFNFHCCYNLYHNKPESKKVNFHSSYAFENFWPKSVNGISKLHRFW